MNDGGSIHFNIVQNNVLIVSLGSDSLGVLDKIVFPSLEIQ